MGWKESLKNLAKTRKPEIKFEDIPEEYVERIKQEFVESKEFNDMFNEIRNQQYQEYLKENKNKIDEKIELKNTDDNTESALEKLKAEYHVEGYDKKPEIIEFKESLKC